jgi:Xaa-Pro aminopeptidase
MNVATSPAAGMKAPGKPSLAERDRRYKLVRAAMAEKGIDVLLLPANHSRWEQMMADSRYITTIGGFGTETFTVFPANGEVTAYLFNRAGWWKKAQNWVADVRDGHNHWAANAIERLNELGFKKGRIGISGLVGLTRAPDGLLPYHTIEEIKKAFPDAEIVDATPLVQAVRSVKSEEEIGLMRHSMTIIERMTEAMKAEARPGNNERNVYAALVSTLLQNGAEMPSLMIFGSGAEIRSGSFVPGTRTLEKGDLIVNEIEARYEGYSCQAVCPLSLGEPKAGYRDIFKVSRACFEAVTERMTPGTTFGELMDVYDATLKAAGEGYSGSNPLMHARGLGDETPALLGKSDVERFRKVTLQPGMVFILKPGVASEKTGLSGRVGDSVVVTTKGGERIGKRPLDLQIV